VTGQVGRPEPDTASDPPRPRRRDPLGLERMVLFSDAVFAIAITLLALDLRLPDRAGGYTDATLLDALESLAPELFAFLLSFVVIAAFWIGHFRTYRLLDRIDGRLIALNLAFLCWVALLPFPTSVVARQGDLPVGAAFYACYATLGGLLSAMLWIYPTRFARLASPRVTPELARRIGIRALVVPLVFAITIPIAIVYPYGAMLGWIVAPVAQLLVSRRLAIGPAMEHSLGSFDDAAPGEGRG
jgi:uncharacterized membrane protein